MLCVIFQRFMVDMYLFVFLIEQDNFLQLYKWFIDLVNIGTEYKV